MVINKSGRLSEWRIKKKLKMTNLANFFKMEAGVPIRRLQDRLSRTLETERNVRKNALVQRLLMNKLNPTIFVLSRISIKTHGLARES